MEWDFDEPMCLSSASRFVWRVLCLFNDQRKVFNDSVWIVLWKTSAPAIDIRRECGPFDNPEELFTISPPPPDRIHSRSVHFCPIQINTHSDFMTQNSSFSSFCPASDFVDSKSNFPWKRFGSGLIICDILAIPGPCLSRHLYFRLTMYVDIPALWCVHNEIKRIKQWSESNVNLSRSYTVDEASSSPRNPSPGGTFADDVSIKIFDSSLAKFFVQIFCLINFFRVMWKFSSDGFKNLWHFIISSPREHRRSV